MEHKNMKKSFYLPLISILLIPENSNSAQQVLVSPKAVKNANEATLYTPYFNSDKNENVTLEDGTSFNVFDELDLQKSEFEDLSLTTDISSTQINDLIANTNLAAKSYQQCLNNTFVPPIINPEKPSTQIMLNPILTGYYSDVIAAIALFHNLGMKLSAELLTRTLSKEKISADFKYIPANSNVCYSSKKLWEIISDPNKSSETMVIW